MGSKIYVSRKWRREDGYGDMRIAQLETVVQ